MNWPTEEWKREQGRKLRKQQVKERLKEQKEKEHNLIRQSYKSPQITKPGMYWLTDTNHCMWIVVIVDPLKGKSKMVKWGTMEIKEVDSIGIGEFIGPIHW